MLDHFGIAKLLSSQRFVEDEINKSLIYLTLNSIKNKLLRITKQFLLFCNLLSDALQLNVLFFNISC